MASFRCSGASARGAAVLVCALIACAWAAPARAYDETTAEELAAAIPEYEATVLVWWAAGCPCVRRYEPRIAALAERWGDRVRVVAVASNADESADVVRRVAGERGLAVPMLIDGDGALAARYGVRTTPTVVVLDAHGRAVFTGWIDNEREPGARGRQPWVEEAVDALLVGASYRPRSPVYGCAITRRGRSGCGCDEGAK